MPDERSPWDLPPPRAVPLAALPWPHHPFKCRYAGRIKALEERYEASRTTRRGEIEAGQAASAEVFLSLTDAEFAACHYHQHDWPAIAAVALELLAAGVTEGYAVAERIRSDARIATRDRHWLVDIFGDPIMWDDGDGYLHNGQHRLCAMRAAGVEACPVAGFIEPGTDYGDPIPARDHARRTVERFRAEDR